MTAWQEFVESHPNSTAFHHAHWIQLLIDQYGLPSHLLAVRQGGHILGAIPFLETADIWGGKKLVSLPFTDCIGVLVEQTDVMDAFREELRSERYNKYKAAVIRTDEPTRRYENAGHWMRHTVDTSQPIDQIYAGFQRTLKTNLRRAEKRSLVFESSREPDALEEFYALQLKTRRKIGVPVQPKRFFRRFHERILQNGLGFVGLVRKNNVAIAAGVFLVYNGTMIFKYMATDPEALDNRPNEFLSYGGIHWCTEHGYNVFDFGISRCEQHGLRQFKQKFGAVETQVCNNYLAGREQPLAEDSKAMKIASTLIRHSPPIVCRALGEVFYRYSQ